MFRHRAGTKGKKFDLYTQETLCLDGGIGYDLRYTWER